MGKAKQQKRYKIYIQVGNELNYLYSLYPVCCCQGQVPQHYESYVDAVSVNNKHLSFNDFAKLQHMDYFIHSI